MPVHSQKLIMTYVDPSARPGANPDFHNNHQPLPPEDVDPVQKGAQTEEPRGTGIRLTMNSGDHIDPSKNLKEKSKQGKPKYRTKV
jgi:hypothetical protein